VLIIISILIVYARVKIQPMLVVVSTDPKIEKYNYMSKFEDIKKCDNCQQSNSEGYLQVKKGGKVVLNLCKECVKCHDCKKIDGEDL